MIQSEAAAADHKTKTTRIVINGRPRDVEGKEITYEQVVELAFGSGATSNGAQYLVSVKKGEGKHDDGPLAPGGSVKLKEGMIFNVSPGNRS